MLSSFDDNVYFVQPFLMCHSLRSSMNRAFATWTANHPVIHFHDVTDACDALLRSRQDSSQSQVRTVYSKWHQPCFQLEPALAHAQERCPLAELWITSDRGDTDLAASVTSLYNWTHPYRKTDGSLVTEVRRNRVHRRLFRV